MRKIIYIGILFICVIFHTAMAQSVRLDTVITNIVFNGQELRYVLDTVSKNYNIRFSYSDSNIPTRTKVYGSYSSCSLKEMMEDILKDHAISYKIIDDHIVLSPECKKIEQFDIRGKIVDGVDGYPIPYVSIGEVRSLKGTSTNDQGEFVLKVKELPGKLQISHLTYLRDSIDVYSSDSMLLIKLTPASTMLKGVTVRGKGDKNAYYKMIRKAYERLAEKGADFNYGKAFYRQKTKRDNDYTELFEIFYDVKYTTTEIEDWSMLEGRYAFNNTNNNPVFVYNKNFTLLSRLFPLKQPETKIYLMPVNEDVDDLFDIELKKVIQNEKRQIAVLEYKPKPTVQEPASRGELFIDINSFDILKIQGRIDDSDLRLAEFQDENSSWNNYYIDYEISFRDVRSELVMDYIKIEHGFSYYHNDRYEGEISTSSLLSFYEYYKPNVNKKLGGRIDYTSSDVDLINHLKYNPDFWAENQVIKLTPLEEKLIKDFEKNQAFRSIFLNNTDEMVLVENNFENGEANQIISLYESQYKEPSFQKIYLHTNQSRYKVGADVYFKAYVLNHWTSRPSSSGSELYVDFVDSFGKTLAHRKYDLIGGMASGSLKLPSLIGNEKIYIQAYNNLENSFVFRKEIDLDRSRVELIKSDDPNSLKFIAMPEGGQLISGVLTKIFIRVENSSGKPYEGSWEVIDNEGNRVVEFISDKYGLGVFKINPAIGHRYFAVNKDNTELRFTLPEVVKEGIALELFSEHRNTLHLHLSNLHKFYFENIYIITSSSGKVFSLIKKNVNSLSMGVDIPMRNIPYGINLISILDKSGKVISERKVYVEPKNELSVGNVSLWKQRRSGRIGMMLEITDENGAACIPDASVSIFPIEDEGLSNDLFGLKEYLLFGHEFTPNIYQRVFNVLNDTSGSSSFNQRLDILLQTIGGDTSKVNTLEVASKVLFDNNMGEPVLISKSQSEDELMAEIYIPGASSIKTKGVIGHDNPKVRLSDQEVDTPGNMIWIPKLDVNSFGVAQLRMKIQDWEKEYLIIIEGVSENGDYLHYSQRIRPSEIRTKKRN